MTTPKISDSIGYQLLRDEDIEAFNQRKAKEDFSDLSGCDFRGLDLRGLKADGLNLSDSYFRNSDLRGIDLRKTKLNGASIAGAKISGCYFPEQLSAEEIRLSLDQGTRMRYR